MLRRLPDEPRPPRSPLLWGVEDGREVRFGVEVDPNAVPRPRAGYQGVPAYDERYGRVRSPRELDATWADPQARMRRIQEMRTRDGDLAGLMAWRSEPLVGAPWSIEEPGTDEEATTSAEEDATAWLREVLIEQPAGAQWRELVTWGCEALWWGFFLVEGRYERRAGRVTPVGWEPRHPTSIVDAPQPWVRDERGRLVAVEQGYQWGVNERRPERMEVERCLLWVYRYDGSPEGNPLTRDLHRAYVLKDQSTINAAIALQKFASPMLIGKLAPGMSRAELEAVQFLDDLSRYQVNHEGAVIVQDGEEITHPSVSDGARLDPEPFRRAMREEFAMALGVPFALFGSQGAGGAYATARTQYPIYARLVESDAQWVAQPLQGLVDRLVRLNWGEGVRSPRVTFGELFPSDVATTVTQLAQAKGAALTGGWQSSDVAMVRELLELEPLDETEAAERRALMPEVRGPQDGEEQDDGEDAEKDAGDVAGDDTEGAREELAAERRGCCASSFAVRLAADLDVPWTPRRPLQGPERYVAFAAIDAEQRDARARIEERTESHRRAAVTDLMAQVRAAVGAGAVERVSTIAVSPELRRRYADAVLEVLADVYVGGWQAVEREVRRMRQHAADLSVVGLGVEDGRLCALLDRLSLADGQEPPTAPENARAIATAQADQLVDESLGPLERQARAKALRALAGGRTLAGTSEQVLTALTTSLLETSMGAVRRAAGVAVPAVFGLGRGGSIRAQAEAEPDEQWVLHFSSMLDGGVCEFCGAAEVAVSQDGGWLLSDPRVDQLDPPLQANDVTGEGCEGRCRCLWVVQMLSLAVRLTPNRVEGR